MRTADYLYDTTSTSIRSERILPLNEQFEVIQNQARQKVIAERYEYSEQIVPLTVITPMNITLKFYPPLKDFKQSVVQDNQSLYTFWTMPYKHL